MFIEVFLTHCLPRAPPSLPRQRLYVNPLRPAFWALHYPQYNHPRQHLTLQPLRPASFCRMLPPRNPPRQQRERQNPERHVAATESSMCYNRINSPRGGLVVPPAAAPHPSMHVTWTVLERAARDLSSQLTSMKVRLQTAGWPWTVQEQANQAQPARVRFPQQLYADLYPFCL